MKTDDIARVTHEANRAYCITIGDTSQVPFLVQMALCDSCLESQ